MLRYADAIVKRGVDKLIDAIAPSAESQTKNTETPQPQKRMGNDTDCAPQTTDSTTNCGLTEQAITLMDELYDIRYNVLDRTPEVQRHDPADKELVSVSKPYLRPLKNPITQDASPPLVLALFTNFITFCTIEWRMLKISELRHLFGQRIDEARTGLLLRLLRSASQCSNAYKWQSHWA